MKDTVMIIRMEKEQKEKILKKYKSYTEFIEKACQLLLDGKLEHLLKMERLCPKGGK